MISFFSEDTLLTFVTVAKLNSFSKAADELGITTAAISYAIKRAETYLGVKLFIRSTRNVELTEAGFYFYRKAEGLLHEFREIETGLNALSDGVEPKVSICINNLLHTAQHTMTLLKLLKRNFPNCLINIDIEVYNGVWDTLITKKADIAIGAPGLLVNGGGIDFQEIGSIHWEFVVPNNHPLALSPEPISESMLRLYPAINIEDTAKEAVIKKTGWILHGQESINVPDLQTKYLSQLNGIGIGFLPNYYVKDDIKKQILIRKEVKNPRQPSRMLLANHHNKKGKVIQWIINEFKDEGKLSNLYKDLLRKN